MVANEPVERHEDDRADEPRAFFSLAAGLFAAPLVVLAAVLASAGGGRLTPTTGCSKSASDTTQQWRLSRRNSIFRCGPVFMGRCNIETGPGPNHSPPGAYNMTMVFFFKKKEKLKSYEESLG